MWQNNKNYVPHQSVDTKSLVGTIKPIKAMSDSGHPGNGIAGHISTKGNLQKALKIREKKLASFGKGE